MVWVIGDLIEVNTSTFPLMLLGRNIQQIGVFFTPLCTLYFSIDYTANKKLRKLAYALNVVQIISVFLLFYGPIPSFDAKKVSYCRRMLFLDTP